jgi:hypothetical protein
MRRLPFLLALFVLVTSGCSVIPSKIDNPQDFMDNLTYTKDYSTGICFALVAIRIEKNPDQQGIGMAQVDCEMAGIND